MSQSFLGQMGLNRTMQYGNLSRTDNVLSKKKSLNRTMQYGNNDILDQYEKENKGLNRTMQYGNAFTAS